MFIAQINLHLRTKQIQALNPVKENPSFLLGYKSYLQTSAINFLPTQEQPVSNHHSDGYREP